MVTINIYSLKQVKEKSGRYGLESRFIRSPKDAYAVITAVMDLQSEAVKKFGILSLNTKNAVAGFHIISVGNLNSSIVHPREVFKAALMNNAASINLFHNHPSGDPTPSPEDVQITRRLCEASGLMGIDVIDHIITGEERFVSLKESGHF